MRTTIETIHAARKRGCPILGVSTPDQRTFQAECVEKLGSVDAETAPPKIAWDCQRGLMALNNEGAAALKRMAEHAECDDVEELAAGTRAAAKALRVLPYAPDETMVFMHNVASFIEEPDVVQGIANLRDPFKASFRTLFLMAVELALPDSLQTDVILVREEKPNDTAIKSIIKDCHEGLGVKLDGKTVQPLTNAVRGMSGFAVEQVVSMSFTSDGKVDLDEAWARKKETINQVHGLKLTRGGRITFDSLRGVDSVAGFLREFCEGPAQPNAIVRIDEIEKSLGGSHDGTRGGDSTDKLRSLLVWMEDNDHPGVIFVGAPGGGKTAVMHATSAEYDLPAFDVDLGAMSGMYRGQSEQRIRTALSTIEGVAAGRALVVATCNRLDSLPPELLRRFRLGIYFFDLPTKESVGDMLKLYAKKYSLPAKHVDQDASNFEGWTGAEIRNVCEVAWALGAPLSRARRRIVPVSVSRARDINEMRSKAHGAFLSASEEGEYHSPSRTLPEPGAPAGARKGKL